MIWANHASDQANNKQCMYLGEGGGVEWESTHLGGDDDVRVVAGHIRIFDLVLVRLWIWPIKCAVPWGMGLGPGCHPRWRVAAASNSTNKNNEDSKGNNRSLHKKDQIWYEFRHAEQCLSNTKQFYFS